MVSYIDSSWTKLELNHGQLNQENQNSGRTNPLEPT